MPAALQTLFTGRNVYSLDSVDSTNNFARELLATTKLSEGTAIISSYQTAGRGQMGNNWQAEPGQNLLCSFLFYPDFLRADQQFYLNMALSLAVKDLCEELLNCEVQVKWPNDIVCCRKKVAGILIENQLTGDRITASIAGIGINVNQTNFESLPNADSLHTICGHSFNLNDCFLLLCNSIEKYYLQLRKGHFNFLERAYTDSLFLYQHTAAFKKGGEIFSGEIDGVDKSGRLIIRSKGREMKFAFKEVEYVF